MAKKIYKSATGATVSFYVRLKDESLHQVKLSNFERTFETEDKALQEAIEQSRFLKEGKIVRVTPETETAPEVKKEKTFEPEEFPEVTDLNGAVEVLTGKPYGVPKKLLKTPEDIRAQAESHNVVFPNLK
jgi:hypothetical protein